MNSGVKIYRIFCESVLGVREKFSTQKYYTLLEDYLRNKIGWELVKDENGDYEIFESDSNELVGRIDRHFDEYSKTLKLEMLTAALDENMERKVGQGILRKIYEFESQLPEKYDIDFFSVEPMSNTVRKKLKEFYGHLSKRREGKTFYIRVNNDV